MSESTQSTKLAGWALGAAKSDLPEDVHQYVRNSIRDTVGCILAGANEDATRSAARLAARRAIDAEALALVLGTAAHAHDFDDVQVPTLVHPSCVIVPTALALAREYRAAPMYAAIAAGQETSLRVGTALLNADGTNSMLFERGFHPTPICTTIGAAITAGLVIGLSEAELAHAVGIAGSLASGILEANRTGGTIKPFHAGWSSAAGIRAAYAAQCGLTGPPTAIEGRFGLLHAFGGAELAARPLGDPTSEGWLLPGTFTKPYPTNGFTHPAIEVAVQLREQGARAEELAKLVVGVARQVLPTIAEPRQAKLRPNTPYHARFSGPVTVALALRGGGGLGLALADFPDELLADAELLSLAERIEVVGDDWASDRFPERLSATGEFTSHTGARLHTKVAVSRGGPERPLTEAEHRAKFDANATGVLPAASVSALAELLAAERGAAVDSLVDLVLAAFPECA
ncbi:2-methylcitrate dehydratase PrpD [Tamaricihabitans halophyticus]|uniref:2-methylcitrate dehydratase PrpD n=1 Tax=Tamaricihabitans halophyticus TaxID=1262583 RepID=A0A4R2R1R1_9PSEU|nr:MmgE/PrpD family protein [Tamaricihabitans halophyticus]TCP56640.1 2-methylcitrate dehydratase PrpD [Tamaricihabitans halophyticus]